MSLTHFHSAQTRDAVRYFRQARFIKYSRTQRIARHLFAVAVMLLALGGAQTFAQESTTSKPLPEPRDAAVRERASQAVQPTTVELG